MECGRVRGLAHCPAWDTPSLPIISLQVVGMIIFSLQRGKLRWGGWTCSRSHTNVRARGSDPRSDLRSQRRDQERWVLVRTWRLEAATLYALPYPGHPGALHSEC